MICKGRLYVTYGRYIMKNHCNMKVFQCTTERSACMPSKINNSRTERTKKVLPAKSIKKEAKSAISKFKAELTLANFT